MKEPPLPGNQDLRDYNTVMLLQVREFLNVRQRPEKDRLIYLHPILERQDMALAYAVGINQDEIDGRLTWIAWRLRDLSIRQLIGIS